MLAASVAPAWVPSSAFGANDRIALAVVGTGGRGRHLARQFAKLDQARVGAACDVDAPAARTCGAEKHKAYGDTGCAGYADFREVLARPDIDGVVIATPDHWHALVGIAAARAGKHIFCEKPLANSIGESRALRDAVRRAGVMLQTVLANGRVIQRVSAARWSATDTWAAAHDVHPPADGSGAP